MPAHNTKLPRPISRESGTLPNGETYLLLRYYDLGSKPEGRPKGPTRKQSKSIAKQEGLPMMTEAEAMTIRDDAGLTAAFFKRFRLKRGERAYVVAREFERRTGRDVCFGQMTDEPGSLNVFDALHRSGEPVPLVLLRATPAKA